MVFKTKGSLLMYLQEAREKYLDLISHAIKTASKDEVECPCCNGRVSVKLHSVNSTVSKNLIKFYKIYGTDLGHISKINMNGGGFAKLEKWRLIVRATKEDIEEYRGKTSGVWRITDKGLLFIKGQLSIPHYVHIFNNKPVGFSGVEVYIKDCLDEDFHYDEFINREGWS